MNTRPGNEVNPCESNTGRAGANTSDFSPIALSLGMAGAVAGGAVGYLIFEWLLGQGVEALVVPGALLGLGFSMAARRHHIAFGIICALLALGLGLFLEWKHSPFIKDESFTYFITHVHQLKTWTLILLGLGCGLAFSFGQGRRGYR